jgi:hypothetical protein
MSLHFERCSTHIVCNLLRTGISVHAYSVLRCAAMYSSAYTVALPANALVSNLLKHRLQWTSLTTLQQ